MSTATLPQTISPEQLRAETDALLTAASGGEAFDIVREGKLVARLVPASEVEPLAPLTGEKNPNRMKWSGLAERRRRIFGDRVTPDSAPILDFLRQDAGDPRRGTDESVFPFPPDPPARPKP